MAPIRQRCVLHESGMLVRLIPPSCVSSTPECSAGRPASQPASQAGHAGMFLCSANVIINKSDTDNSLVIKPWARSGRSELC